MMSCKRIRLVVKDSADESSYVPVLEAAGYVLQIREPDWFEHRLFKGHIPYLPIRAINQFNTCIGSTYPF